MSGNVILCKNILRPLSRSLFFKTSKLNYVSKTLSEKFNMISSSQNSAKVAKDDKKTLKQNIIIQDPKCDSEISCRMSTAGLEDAVGLLKYYSHLGRHPARHTFKSLIKQATNELSLSAIISISSILLQAYPLEHEWEMGYKHFLAEYHWKCGEYDTAMNLFENLLETYPKRTKKICDTMKFMFISIIEYQFDNHLDYAMKMVKRNSEKGIHYPAANLWFLLFTSPSGRHHYFANELFESLLINEHLARKFQNKIDNLLQTANRVNNIEILQRSIPVLSKLKLPDETSKVYNTMLKLQCINEDYTRAASTFHHACREKIILSAEVIEMISNLSKLVKRK